MIRISRQYDSAYCFWKGYELFVFVQDIKHIAVSCYYIPNIVYVFQSFYTNDIAKNVV
jgi:hypothetical protein